MQSLLSLPQRQDGPDAIDLLVAVDRRLDVTLDWFEAHALRDRRPVRPTRADR